MKFVIEHVSKSSGRLGYLLHASSEKQLKTPILLHTTKAGSVPYLSREVFNYVTKEPQLLQLSLSTMDQMADSVAVYKDGLSSYVGYASYPNFMMLRDPCEEVPSGFNDNNVVPMFTRRGKEVLTAQKYMDMIQRFAPDVYQGLDDADTNVLSSKKRIQKSVDRTRHFMEDCYRIHTESKALKNSTLFVPIVGGYCKRARSECIRHCNEKGGSLCDGYLLEGFHHYGLSATAVDAKQLIDVVRHCVSELDELKPKLMPGAFTPVVILELITLGIDMFDTSYAYLAATNFKALTFDHNWKKPRQLTNNLTTPFLDLTDSVYKEDFTPILEDCKCLACRKHTRAYVHHLYNTKELLAPVLLMMHNVHHLMEFFESIRMSISDDCSTELLRLIKFQSDNEEIDYQIHKISKTIPDTNFGKCTDIAEGVI